MQTTSPGFIDPKELSAYKAIISVFSGMTLQSSYNALQAVRSYLIVLGENADANEFIFK